MTFELELRKRSDLGRVLACVAVLALGACAEDDDPNYISPPPSNVTADGQVSTGNDGGVAPADAGAAKPPDTGTVTTGPDAQVPAPADAQVSLDAQTPPADTGVSTGGDATTGGDAATGGDATTGSAHMDLGKGDGKDVIAIGDSWMLLITTGVQTGLKKASGQPYRTFGVPATTVLSGQIPGQFDSAKRADPDIKTVVMTGGGNDILLDATVTDCPSGGPKCDTQLDKIAKALDVLWTNMSKSGVQDVVHVMYSAAAVATNPVKNLPAHNERIKQLCSSHPPMRCFQLNTDKIAPTTRDGIHPTNAGYDAIGKAAFELMVKEGMRR